MRRAGASGQTSSELQSTSAERRPRGGSYGPLPVQFRDRGPGAFPFALARAPLRVRGLVGRAVGCGGEGARPVVCVCGLPAGVRVPRVGALRPEGAAVEGGCCAVNGSPPGSRWILGQGLRGGGPGRPLCWRTMEESCKGLGSVSLKINTQHTLHTLHKL